MMNLGEVTGQLINATESELEQMAGESPRVTSEGGQVAVEIARGWIEQVVSEYCQPSSDAFYYAFEGDGKDRCDIVRVRYAILEGEIEIAQTFSMISIVIHRPKSADESMLEHVVQIGRRCLKEADRLKLEISAQEEGFVIGHQASQRPQPRHADFIDQLRWWTDAQRVGFVTLKQGTHASRARMSWDKVVNLTWFSLYE